MSNGFQQPLSDDDSNGSHIEKRGQRKVATVNGIEFEQLEPEDLKSLSILIQALDNQWLPLSLLSKTFKKGEVSGRLEKQLRRLVRSEYMRSLINGEQVIMNRAFVYNNPVISQDYVGKDKGAYKAFKSLMEDEVIALYLLGEKYPVDTPVSRAGTLDTFDTHDIALEKWRQLCSETKPRCVRLSWDDQENAQLSRRLLNDRFSEFSLSVQGRDCKQFLHDLRPDRFETVDDSTATAFRMQLRRVERMSEELLDQGNSLTRNEFYKRFVTTGNPSERHYDSSKPFAEEMKLLFDLAYNCNLPDALGGYLITPAGSPPRTVLQEWQQLMQKKNIQEDIDGEELVRTLQRTAFSLVNQGLNLPSMDLLRLQDVCVIRDMDEWKEYIQQMKFLLINPLSFVTNASHVFEKYTHLAERITYLVKERRSSSILTAWEPCMELIFTIGGATLSCLWAGHEPIWTIVGTVETTTASVVGRLVIRNMMEKKATSDLSNSIDFMRGQMRDARKQWREIVRLVKTLKGFEDISESLPEEQIDSVVNYQLEY